MPCLIKSGILVLSAAVYVVLIRIFLSCSAALRAGAALAACSGVSVKFRILDRLNRFSQLNVAMRIGM